MDRQQDEISDLELTTEELNDVTGGIKNNQTEAWGAFQFGIRVGLVMAGGHVSCTMD